MTRQLQVAEFLRAQAAWRLARAHHDPIRSARCAAALLDAAAYAAGLADDDRNLVLLARGGCFRGQVFDPGPDAVALARWWQYQDATHAGPRELLGALAEAAAATAEAGLTGSRPGGRAGAAGV